MIETRSSNGPICPHCGFEYTPDEAYFYSEDYTREKCCSCNKEFYVSVYHKITWTCRKDKEIK